MYLSLPPRIRYEQFFNSSITRTPGFQQWSFVRLTAIMSKRDASGDPECRSLPCTDLFCESAYIWNGIALIPVNMRKDLMTGWHCMPQRHNDGPTIGWCLNQELVGSESSASIAA